MLPIICNRLVLDGGVGGVCCDRDQYYARGNYPIESVRVMGRCDGETTLLFVIHILFMKYSSSF